MIYTNFSERLNRYLHIYERGLKKQANAEISAIVKHIHGLPRNEQDYIIFKFLSDYCDKDIWDSLKKRGNGDIPFELKEYIRQWITPRCEDKKMPELRWYYELYRNHKTGCQLALKFLEEAYSSKESDQKTIDLLFDSYLDTLAWGAHHFPDGCIIEKEKIIFCMQKCEDILNEKSVREDLINRLQYYKKLYLCYSKYVEDGKKRNFGVYLKEANIDFYYSKAYYYER